MKAMSLKKKEKETMILNTCRIVFISLIGVTEIDVVDCFDFLPSFLCNEVRAIYCITEYKEKKKKDIFSSPQSRLFQK
jgi:hypothetical protein